MTKMNCRSPIQMHHIAQANSLRNLAGAGLPGCAEGGTTSCPGRDWWGQKTAMDMVDLCWLMLIYASVIVRQWVYQGVDMVM